MKRKQFIKLMCMILASTMMVGQLPATSMGVTKVLASESSQSQLSAALEMMSTTEGLLKAGSISVTTDGKTSNQPFSRGTDGVDIFRIPCLITLQNGDILAAADARYTEYRDFGGIDTIASVSSDGGKTWSYSYPIYFPDSTGSAGFGKATTAIDPILVQGKDGTIFCMADMNPTGVTTFDTWPGVGTGYITVDGKERLALTSSWDTSATQPSESAGADGNYTYEYYVGDFTDGYAPVIDRKTGQPSTYAVDEWYNIYTVKDGEYVADLTQQVVNNANTTIQQNAFYKDSVLHVYKTGYIWVVESKDNGRSWQNPRIINPQVKKDNGSETALLVSPGQGLTTSTGDILVGCYETIGGENAGFFYSSDNGVTWKRTAEVSMSKSSENEMIELEDGTIRMFYRNDHMKICYVDATRDANGDYTFGSPQITSVVSSSNCNVTAVKLKEKTIDGKPVILVACPSTTGAWNRNAGRIFVFTENTDKTMDLVHTYNVNEGAYAYSCMTELSNGNIGLLWESGNDGNAEMRYDEFAIEEVLGEVNEKDIIVDKGTEYVETYVTNEAMEVTTPADDSIAQVRIETDETRIVPMFDRSGTANSSAPRESFSATANSSISLENAEFEFQPQEAENVYKIYNKFSDKYLTNASTANTYFNAAAADMYVEAVDAEEGKKEFRISLANKTRYIMFYFTGMNFNGNSGGYNNNMTNGSQELVLLEKQDTVSASDVIPGYTRATQVTEGKKYLITYIMGTNVIVLYPTNGQDAQTKLVDTTVEPEVMVTNKVKITPVANGTTSAVVDGKTYHIQVKTPVIKSDVISATAGSQQSASGANSAAAAVDGVLDNMWQTHATNDKNSYDNHWITVDLGRKYKVDGFRYFTRKNGTQGCITKYEVYTSVDGTTFTKATEGSWDYINYTWYEADFAEREARYVKLKTVESQNGSASGKLSTAAEIQVRGVKANEDADYSAVDAALATVPEDLSNYTEETVVALQTAINNVKRGYDVEKQAEVTAMAQAITAAVAALEEKLPGVSYKISSSGITVTTGSQHATSGDNSASAALDGNASTVWHTNWNNDVSSNEKHWITFDLGENYMVDTLRYLSRTGSINGIITKYEIYTSLDGQEFTKATEGDWAGANGTWYEAAIPATEARYVKLKSVEARSDNSSKKFASAAEIEIKGYKKVEGSETPDQTVAVTGVSLNKTTTALTVGQNETLTATVAPENATNKAVTWSSSNAAVATVDNTGKVVAVAAGTATITVTTADGSKTASCTVTVTAAEDSGNQQPTTHEHTYGEVQVTKAPTCTEKGEGTKTCTVKDCGHSETVEVAANGHAYAETFTVDKAATCTEAGSQSKHCANCDATAEVTAIPVIAHTSDTGVITKQPTATTKGEKTYSCTVCKTVVKTEEIPATGAGDQPGTGDITKPGDTTTPGTGDITKPGDTTTPGTGDTTKPGDTTTPGTGDTTKPEETKKPLAKGKKFTVKNGTYKVTKAAIKGGTVTFVSAKKNSATITVPATVKYEGITYKVTSVEKNAFKNQKKATKITIGKNVTKIGATAFANCIKLKNIKIQSAKFTKKSLAKTTFKGVKTSVKISVPKAKLKAYKTLFKKAGLNSKVKVTK